MKELYRSLKIMCTVLAVVGAPYAQGYLTQGAGKTPGEQRATYILSITAPHPLATQDISCVYHGNHTYFKDKYCTLSQTTLRNFFSLIITPSVEFKDDGGYLVDKKACKWYNLTLYFKESETDASKRYYSWEIEEVPSTAMPHKIPSHGIVVQLPAHFISKLEELPVKGPFAIHLPQIVLKESVTQELLNKALEEIALGIPELKVRCSHPYFTVKKHQTHLIAQTETRQEPW